MENVTWSKEMVLSTVKEFNNAIDSLREKAPDFKHFAFVKIGLLFLKQAKMTTDWTITNDNETAVSILNYFDEITANENITVSTDDNNLTLPLKTAIQEIYSTTLCKIPDENDSFVDYSGPMLSAIFIEHLSDQKLSNVFSNYNKSRYSDEKQNFFVKGLSCLIQLLINKVITWEDTITCEFNNMDEAYCFYLVFNVAKQMMTMENSTIYINRTSVDDKNGYDRYFDANFDFNHIDDIFGKMNPNGTIIAGVAEREIFGQNEALRELFINDQVNSVHVDDSGFGWVEIELNNINWTVSVYSPEDNQYHEIMSEEIVRFGFSLDCSKYDVFEKVDEFILTLSNLRDSFGYGIGYDECMASLFLVPYFKLNHKGVLSNLIDDFDPNYDVLQDNYINQEFGPEKIQIVRALNACVSKMRYRDFVTDVKYQQFLNAMRLIDSIDDNAFHKYYPEVIERICDNIITPSYISQYYFVESQLGSTDNLQVVVRKEDNADIAYSGDGGIEEQTSYSGWGSLVTPNVLKAHNIDVEMDFLVNNIEDYDPICSAAQYIIFDALHDENKDQRVCDFEIQSYCGVADIIIDLHRDVRQYETISAKRLKPGGQYVTFAMKKDMESCQPVIEKLIKENVLDKVISLNNRYLLFINQSKQDDKVVLAKFNHIDDERFSESYQSIIHELSFEDGTPHVLILSNNDLASENYSISTDDYFFQCVEDVEGILQKIVSRFYGKHKLMDVFLNILLRVESLYREGNPTFTFESQNVKKLDNVLDYMKEYEEILMENYDECIDWIIRLFGSEGFSYEFYQPEIAQLMVNLLSPKEVHNLFNPFAGAATFADLLPDTNYCGNEINADVHTLGTLRLNAHDLVHHGYSCENSYEFVKSLPKEVMYDTILSIPPFMPDEEGQMYDFLFNQCMSHLEEQGFMMVAIPSSFMFNRSQKIADIRKKIIENRWVEKVIALPKGSFQGTNVSTCLIQLSKRDNQEILFCDTTQLFELNKNKVSIQTNEIVAAIMNRDADCCFSTPYAEISNNNYSLNIFWYKPIPAKEGYSTYRLGDLLTKIERKHSSDNNGLTMSSDMLSSDALDSRKTKFDLKMGTIDRSMLQIQGDALILSSYLSNLKPTFMEADNDTTYYITRNTLAFRVNQTFVTPDYLCYALRLPEVMQQIDNYRTGVLANISSENFLNIQINLPDLSVQRAIVDDLAREQYAKKKQELNKMYGDVYAEKEEEFKSLKHAMGKSVAGINAAVDNLYNYFDKTGMLDTIVQTRRNTTVADKLKVIKDSIHHIEVLMQNGADFLDVSQYPLSSVSISEIWSNIHYETERFSVNKSEVMIQSMSEVNVRMNLDLFKILINDIMSNAEKHAFFDNDPANVVRVEISSDNAWLTLLISNNGEPFPKDVDVQKFTKRHWSAGEHRGSGIGGHDIQKIVKAFQGEFELIPDYKETFPTCYVLRFPIE